MKTITSIIGLLILLILFGSWNYNRKFPDFNYKTIEGKTITNDYFNDSNTLVIHFRFGCGPSMYLLKDLQLLQEEKLLDCKILLIAENTNIQILEFNSEEEKYWSEMRKRYGIQKITFDIIGECTQEKTVEIDGVSYFPSQCRKLSKKLRTNSSPYIYKVNGEGRIIGKFGGYTLKSNKASLINILENL